MSGPCPCTSAYLFQRHLEAGVGIRNLKPRAQELLFIAAGQNPRKMMALDVKSGFGDSAKFAAAVLKALFHVDSDVAISTGFDVSKDGRFLIPTSPNRLPPRQSPWWSIGPQV